MVQVLNYQQRFNLMKFIKNFILVFLFIFPISSSYGAMVTSVQNETFADNSSREINGIAFNEDGTKMKMPFEN